MTPTEANSTTESSLAEKIARELIEEGAESWDVLSDYEQAALSLVLHHRFTVLAALIALVAEVEKRDEHRGDLGISRHAEVMSNARHYIRKATEL